MSAGRILRQPVGHQQLQLIGAQARRALDVCRIVRVHNVLGLLGQPRAEVGIGRNRDLEIQPISAQCEHLIAQVGSRPGVGTWKQPIVEKDRFVLRRQLILEGVNIEIAPPGAQFQQRQAQCVAQRLHVGQMLDERGGVEVRHPEQSYQGVELVLGALKATLQAQESMQSIEKGTQR